MFSKTFLLEGGCNPTIYQESFDFKCSRPDEVVVLLLVLVVLLRLEYYWWRQW